MRDNGNVNIVKANAGVDRDVRRVTELDDGKRTTDYNVGVAYPRECESTKTANEVIELHLKHMPVGTKRVIELDDGKRTNLVKGEVESSHLLKLNQDGSKTQEVKVGADASVGTKRQTNLDDGKRTTGVLGDVGVSDKIRIDKDGNKSHEIRGNVGVEGLLQRKKM